MSIFSGALPLVAGCGGGSRRLATSVRRGPVVAPAPSLVDVHSTRLRQRAPLRIDCAGQAPPSLSSEDKAKYLMAVDTKTRLLGEGTLREGFELLESDKVRLVTRYDLGSFLEAGFKLLDIRAPYEFAKARVKGSLHVPSFVKDDSGDVVTGVRRVIQFGWSGAWNGQPLTKANENFIEEVEKVLGGKKDSYVIVCCAQGLRSLSYIKIMADAGYSNLAWLYGGLQYVDDYVEIEGDDEMATAGIDGIVKAYVQASNSLGNFFGGDKGNQ